MANTIKLKRGLSSNLSNLVLQEGELALTTDTNEIYSLNSEGTPESITPKVLADRTYGFASNFNWARDEQSIIPVELPLDNNSNIKVVLSAELDETLGEQTLEYELSPVISDDKTTVCLGNLSIMDSSLEDTGEPFLFVSQYENGMFGGTMLQFNNDVVQDANFVLYSTTSSKGLDKKLLDDNIIINVSDLSAISLELFNVLGISQEMLIYYGYAGLFANIIEKIVIRYYTVSLMGTATYIDHYVTNNALAWTYTITPKILFASNIRTMSDGTVDYNVSYRYRIEMAIVENRIKCDEEPEMVILSNQQLDWDRYNDVANRPFGEYKMNPKNSISYDGDTPGFGNISIYCGKGLNFRADGWKLKVDLFNDNFRYYEGTYSNENNEAKWSFRIEDLRYGTESEVFVGDIVVAYDSATGIANFRMYREDDTEADSPFRMELVNESLNKRLSASNLDIFELSEYSPININVVNGTGTVNMTPIIGNSYDVIYNGITYTLKYYHFDSSDKSVSIDLMGDLYTATGNSYVGHTDIFGFAIYNDNGVIKFKTDDTSFTGTVSVQPSGKKQILKDEFLELKTINGEPIKGSGDIEIPRGESGVYIGEEEPTDSDINVWIDPDAEGLVIPTKTSDLINDSGFITENELGDIKNNIVLENTRPLTGGGYVTINSFEDILSILGCSLSIKTPGSESIENWDGSRIMGISDEWSYIEYSNGEIVIYATAGNSTKQNFELNINIPTTENGGKPVDIICGYEVEMQSGDYVEVTCGSGETNRITSSSTMTQGMEWMELSAGSKTTIAVLFDEPTDEYVRIKFDYLPELVKEKQASLEEYIEFKTTDSNINSTASDLWAPNEEIIGTYNGKTLYRMTIHGNGEYGMQSFGIPSVMRAENPVYQYIYPVKMYATGMLFNPETYRFVWFNDTYEDLRIETRVEYNGYDTVEMGYEVHLGEHTYDVYDVVASFEYTKENWGVGQEPNPGQM